MVNRTELLTRPGSFDLSLKAGCPQSIRRQLRAAADNRDGFVVQFATCTPAPDLSFATYTGVVAEYNDRAVSGFGLPGLLQTDDNIGRHVDNNRTHDGTGQTIEEWIDLVLPFAGITKGTEFPTLNANVPGFWWMGLGARELLDHVIYLGQASIGNVALAWRVNPNGTFDWGRTDSLFVDDPTVMILADPSPSRGGGKVRVMRGQIDRYSLNARQVAENVYVYGSGFGDDIPVFTATAASVPAYGLDGAAAKATFTVQAGGTDDSELQDQADDVITRASEPIETFDVNVEDSTARLRTEPGDVVYVYDEALPIVGDGSDMVEADGRLVNARRVRVTGMRTDSIDGEGFWLYDSRTSSWTDLTPWVLTGSGRSRWTVTTDLGPGGIAGLRSPNRLDITTDPNPNPPPPLPDPGLVGGPGTNPGGYEIGRSY